MPEQTIKDVKKEIYLALHKAQEMLELTEEGFMKNKLASLDKADELAAEIQQKEDNLTAMLAKIASTHSEARTLLGVPGHVEKIASGIQRVTEGTRLRLKEGMLFSDKAIHETGLLFEKTRDVLKKAGEAVVTGSQDKLNSVVAEANAIEDMTSNYATAHEDRLVTGECTPKTSSTYLCILYAFEEMGAHIKGAVTRYPAQ